jgi:hypothetical protein
MMPSKKTKRIPMDENRNHKTASSLLLALPSLSLAEETLEQIETQLKERRRYPARIPRL